jgi:ribosomal protein L24
MKIRTGDNVMVIAGKDSGKEATVLKVLQAS